jgi:hypothetical protein
VKIKNVSPLGDLDVPLLGNRIVKAGEEVDVPDEKAKRLLLQPDNWRAAPEATTRPTASAPKADWLDYAASIGVLASEEISKKDLIAAVTTHEANDTANVNDGPVVERFSEHDSEVPDASKDQNAGEPAHTQEVQL